jgi:proprotein convertase subtilisin/kexin type 5
VTVANDGSINCACILTGYSLNCSVSFISSINSTLIILGLTNPTSASSSYWNISIYAGSAILISSDSSSNQFIAACGTNCRDCINSTYCKSCYSNPSINNQTYLNQLNNQCINTCNSTGQYLVGSICYSCNSSCLSCSLFSSNCTSCPTGSSLYGGSCLAQCPDSYYSSSQTCVACINNCLTCTSASACLTCSTNYVLQSNSTCLLTCPSGQYNSSNVCTICSTNCLTCDVNGCLTCTTPYLLTGFTYPTCVLACPTNAYISISNLLCEICQSPCLTCSIYSNNCTSCLPASGNTSLLNFRCLASCPSQTYSDELNQCQACQSPCLNCNSLNKCTSCANSLVLYTATN